jgi:hypothetical protein
MRGPETTLFIMPHCERHLYEAVLAASERAAALERTAILGNSFAEYGARLSLSSTPADALSPLLRFIGQAIGALPALKRPGANGTELTHASEVPVVPERVFPISAFNSMSLHLFKTRAA